MPNKCASFDEVCRRAGGRRAYNRRRRIIRAARISAIIALQERAGQISGRELAARFSVHEATISRDLKFIGQIRADYRRKCGAEMWASSFSWTRDALGWRIAFEIRNGLRVR